MQETIYETAACTFSQYYIIILLLYVYFNSRHPRWAAAPGKLFYRGGVSGAIRQNVRPFFFLSIRLYFIRFVSTVAYASYPKIRPYTRVLVYRYNTGATQLYYYLIVIEFRDLHGARLCRRRWRRQWP